MIQVPPRPRLPRTRFPTPFRPPHLAARIDNDRSSQPTMRRPSFPEGRAPWIFPPLANTMGGERQGIVGRGTTVVRVLFLHGWNSKPGGVKPTYLAEHGHTVINPALPDEDFDAAVKIAQEAFYEHRPDVVVGSSREVARSP